MNAGDRFGPFTAVRYSHDGATGTRWAFRCEVCERENYFYAFMVQKGL